MARTSQDIRVLARAHTATAINVLAGIMREKRAPPAARVAAAQALLDRGWGKAPIAIESDGAAITLIITGVPDDEPMKVIENQPLTIEAKAQPIEDDAIKPAIKTPDKSET